MAELKRFVFLNTIKNIRDNYVDTGKLELNNKFKFDRCELERRFYEPFLNDSIDDFLYQFLKLDSSSIWLLSRDLNLDQCDSENYEHVYFNLLDRILRFSN